MHLPRPSIKGIFLSCVLATAVPFAAALPEDRAQAIHITADRALRDERQGHTVYSGNVELDQGSLHISADKITIFRIVEDGDKIVAWGQPATLQQQPNIDEKLMRAHANIIEYYKEEDRVHLRGNAQMEQGGSTVKGESIEYFISQQLVKASSDKTLENSRVQVVIEANTINKSEEERGKANGE